MPKLTVNQRIAIFVPIAVALLGTAAWKGPSLWQTVTGNNNTQTSISSAAGGVAVGRDQITTQNNYSIAQPAVQEFAKSFDLQLETFGDQRAPGQLSLDNVWRWYFLRTILQVFLKTGETVQAEGQTLFIVFDKPVLTSHIAVSAIGFDLPAYEVKEFTNRYAIIVFFGSKQLPKGSLRIKTGQDS